MTNNAILSKFKHYYLSLKIGEINEFLEKK